MTKRFCPECGAQLLEEARFCSKCRHEIKQDSQPQTAQVEMSGYCDKCGAQLIKGASFCSKCRAPVGARSEALKQPQSDATAKSVAANVQNHVQSAAQKLGISAPAQSGELSFSMPDPMGTAAEEVKRRFGIVNILAGLGAGGVSFAALLKTDRPMLMSACAAAGIVVVRVAVGLVRRGRRRRE